MRVSIVNCVSTVAEMMRFSDQSLFENAKHDELDYVVVKWLASAEVEAYLAELPAIAQSLCPGATVQVVEHQTDDSIGYVPNLRAMMNEGFDVGFALNRYCGLTNTDVYHGPSWLRGLVRWAGWRRVINSLHITAVPLEDMKYPRYGIINENLGIPEPGKFDRDRFEELFNTYYRDCMMTADQINRQGGHEQAATMPYLFHRDYWESCGPWDTTFDWSNHAPAPDESFFGRIAAAGAEFAMTDSSIIYHAEGVERKCTRPPGTEHLPEE